MGTVLEKPFSDTELSVLVSGDSPANRKAIDERPEVAYGTTPIACLITTGFVIYLQIGDGDVLSISSEGEVFRPALSTRHPVAGWELHPLETNTFSTAHLSDVPFSLPYRTDRGSRTALCPSVRNFCSSLPAAVRLMKAVSRMLLASPAHGAGSRRLAVSAGLRHPLQRALRSTLTTTHQTLPELGTAEAQEVVAGTRAR